MECKCGGTMLERVQIINKNKIDYKHCKGCTRNYVDKHNQIKLKEAELEGKYK